jgi:hypothetical protein
MIVDDIAMQNVGMAVLPTAIGGVQDASSINGTKWSYVIPIFMIIVCLSLDTLIHSLVIGNDTY